MSRNVAHNPHGKRVRTVHLVEPAFELPAATTDETAPTGRVIRREVKKRPFTVLDAIETIRQISREAQP